MELEDYLRNDDRIVLPIGSVEQHGYLSLATDMIVAERIAVEASEPLKIPVMPVLPYGVTPYFAAYPGSPSLRASTYEAVLSDLLESFYHWGFRRIAMINDHGGNNGGRPAVEAWQAAHGDAQVLWINWWEGPRAKAVIDSIDHDASHASWMENFPWTRLGGVVMPEGRKKPVDISEVKDQPLVVRQLLGDGSFGGPYSRPDEDVMQVWHAGVTETRERLNAGWR